MRRRLGLDPALPAILLVGGGEGMGALEGTVTKLGEELGPTAQVGSYFYVTRVVSLLRGRMAKLC